MIGSLKGLESDTANVLSSLMISLPVNTVIISVCFCHFDSFCRTFNLDFLSDNKAGESPFCSGKDDEKHSLLHADKEKRSKGLNLFTSALFIVAEICGGGALVLPMALTKTGLSGNFL